MTRGFFLVIEGTEGAGKTSLARSLADRFRALGTEPVMVREPGGTPVAERVRAVLLDPEAEIEPASELFLFLAARSDLVARVIRPELARWTHGPRGPVPALHRGVPVRGPRN